MYFETSIIFFLPYSVTREIIFSSNLICMCTLELVRISFFELRSFGSNQHRIFKASEGGAEHILLSNKGRNLCVCLSVILSNKGRNLCVCLSVCIFIMSRTIHPIDFTRVGYVAADPSQRSVSFWCNMDTRNVQN